MEPDPAVLESLRNAVNAMPDDVPLRLHFAALLLRAGQRDEAVRHLGAVLQRDPGNAEALTMLTQDQSHSPERSALTPPSSASRGPAAPAAVTPSPSPAADGEADVVEADVVEADTVEADTVEAAGERSGQLPRAESASEADADRVAHRETHREADREQPPEGGDPTDYDWTQAETELRGVLPEMFLGDDAGSSSAGIDEARAYDAEHAGLTLADVAGMTEVKQRLEAAFLAPMRNPELRKLYGKSLRGGLLLYGPPGCGKTFVARAVAGELGARFISVSFADLIDMFVGRSERNIHELFEVARRNAPCVVFLDEVDAIGQKRSQLRNTPMRSAVNQLLLELDDVASDNTGVFLLAATNHPWDVDSALRRPGRFDRTLLVLPPDGPAREGVFRYHLRERPVAGIDLTKLSKITDGYSGADIAHICETAAERALLDSVRRGEARLIGQADLEAAAAEVKPSLGTWFDTARNVALFANEGGAYDDLVAYLRKRRLI